MIPNSNEIRIEVTTKCNYKCVICPRDKLTRKIETMSFELYKMIFDKVTKENPKYNILTFPGMGEPLLDENLESKIIYGKERGFNVLILTNGSLLTIDKFKKFEEIGVDSIRVSIYGNSIENYNYVHGIGNKNLFNQIKYNLTEISKLKSKTKLLLTYNMVEGHNTLDYDGWVDYWKDKVDLLEVWHPHNWVNGKKYRTVQSNKLKTCGRPFNTPLQIQVDGTVNMCCFDFDGKLLLGDLKTQTLQEIFSSPMFQKINKCHVTGDYRNSGIICEDCDQRNADKSNVMAYNSLYNINERVMQVSTTYKELVNKDG